MLRVKSREANKAAKTAAARITELEDQVARLTDQPLEAVPGHPGRLTGPVSPTGMYLVHPFGISVFSCGEFGSCVDFGGPECTKLSAQPKSSTRS